MTGVVLGWTREVLSLPLTAYRIVYLVFNHMSGTISAKLNFCSPNNSVRDACYAGLKHPSCFFFTSLSLFPFIYLIILTYRVLTLLFTCQKTVDYHSSIFQSKAWVSLSHLYVTSFNLSAFLTYVSCEKYSFGSSLRKASDSSYLFGVIFQIRIAVH